MVIKCVKQEVIIIHQHQTVLSYLLGILRAIVFEARKYNSQAVNINVIILSLGTTKLGLNLFIITLFVIKEFNYCKKQIVYMYSKEYEKSFNIFYQFIFIVVLFFFFPRPFWSWPFVRVSAVKELLFLTPRPGRLFSVEFIALNWNSKHKS